MRREWDTALKPTSDRFNYGEKRVALGCIGKKLGVVHDFARKTWPLGAVVKPTGDKRGL